MAQTIDSAQSKSEAPAAGKYESAPSSIEQASVLSGANLADSDHQTFLDAQKASLGKGASDHVIGMTLPLALNKDVYNAHENLAAMADSQLSPAAAAEKFKADMDKFESHADAQGLKPEQVKETYGQIREMLGANPQSPFTADQRRELVGQLMERLADPTNSARQGYHSTCAWTVLEGRLLKNNPEAITAKLAEVVATGGVTVIDVDQATKMAAAGNTPAEPPARHIQLDKSSLEPDQEAQGASPHADRRDFVDQIAQVMEDNIKWDAQTTTPAKQNVPEGSMQFLQCSTIERPGDLLTNGERAAKTCESVSFTDPQNNQKTVWDGNGSGFGGDATVKDVALVNQAITGNAGAVVLLRSAADTVPQPNTYLAATSAAQLKSQLEERQKAGELPLGAMVEIAQPGVIADYLARHPEKTADQVDKNSWHVLSINGIDSQGNVQIYNPWGLKRTFTVDELFNAMGSPK